MRKIILAIAFIMFSFLSSAQDQKMKDILSSSIWKPDIETMKDAALKKIESLPEMKNLTYEEKKVVLQSVLSSVKKMRYVFGSDSYFKLSISDTIKYEGSYTIDLNLSQLITDLQIEPNSTYQIISYDESRIVLYHIARKNDLILIKE